MIGLTDHYNKVTLSYAMTHLKCSKQHGTRKITWICKCFVQLCRRYFYLQFFQCLPLKEL